MWWFHGLLVAILVLEVSSQLKSVDTTDWIDPSDMINYDSNSQTMINKKPQNQNENTVGTSNNCEGEDYIPGQLYRDLEDLHKKCVKESELLIKESQTASVCDGSPSNLGNEGAFFRRYVKSLMLNFDSSGGNYQLWVTLSEADMEVLNNFVSLDGRVEDAVQVLISMVQYTVPLYDSTHLSLLARFENYINMDLTSLCKIMALFMMASITFAVFLRLNRTSHRQLLTRLFLVIFFISVPWNWFHLYKIALAKRYAEMLKDRPSQCNPSDQSVPQSIYQWVISAFSFSSDACAKYHEKLLIDPIWEVPPTQALAVTLTKFFLEPLQHIGVAVSALIRGLLEDMPIFMWPFSIAFAMGLIVFTLLIMSGYRVRFLWNVFQLEPAQYPVQAPHEAVQDVQQNRQSHGSIQEVQNRQPQPQSHQLQAVEDVPPANIPNQYLLKSASSCGQDEVSLVPDVADQLPALAIGTEQCSQALVADSAPRHHDTSNERTLEPEGVASKEDDSVKTTTTICIVDHPASAQSSLTESLLASQSVEQPALLQTLGPLSGNEQQGDNFNHTRKQAVRADIPHQPDIPVGTALARNRVQEDVRAQGDCVIPSTHLESAANLDLVTLRNGEVDVQPPMEDPVTSINQ